MYARLMGKTPFVIYQGRWNILEREFEREIIPMAKEEGKWHASVGPIPLAYLASGMALAPWSVLAAGKIRTDEEEERRRKTGENGKHGSDRSL